MALEEFTGIWNNIQVVWGKLIQAVSDPTSKAHQSSDSSDLKIMCPHLLWWRRTQKNLWHIFRLSSFLSLGCGWASCLWNRRPYVSPTRGILVPYRVVSVSPLQLQFITLLRFDLFDFIFNFKCLCIFSSLYKLCLTFYRPASKLYCFRHTLYYVWLMPSFTSYQMNCRDLKSQFLPIQY